MGHPPSPQKSYISVKTTTLAVCLVSMLGVTAIAAQSEVFEPIQTLFKPPTADLKFDTTATKASEILGTGGSEASSMGSFSNLAGAGQPASLTSFSSLWNEYYSSGSQVLGGSQCSFGGGGAARSTAKSSSGGKTTTFGRSLTQFLPWAEAVGSPSDILNQSMGALCTSDPFIAQSQVQQGFLNLKAGTKDNNPIESNRGIQAYAASDELLRKATELQSQTVLGQEAQAKTKRSMDTTIGSVDATLQRAQAGQSAPSTQQVMKYLLTNQAEQSALMGFMRLEQLQQRQDTQLTNLNLVAVSRSLQAMQNAEQAQKIADSYGILGSSYADLCVTSLCRNQNYTNSSSSFVNQLKNKPATNWF
jgi:hypothetical protein